MIYDHHIIEEHFDNLTPKQLHQFQQLYAAYAEWNGRINVISRKDFDALYLHHVLHSLAIARVCQFNAGARIADVGCGGGFPSVPLAILFPEANFTAIDSIRKKISVVEGVCKEVGIENITAINARIESIDQKFDYVVSRAVTNMKTFVDWVWGKIGRGQTGTLPNGILYLKGGDLTEELAATAPIHWQRYPISNFFTHDFFETKEVVYTPKK